MSKTQSTIDSLLSECSDLTEAYAPVTYLMPNFYALGLDWCHDCANSHIRDEFTIWSDVVTKSTYAVIRSIGGFFRGDVFAGEFKISGDKISPESAKVSIAGYRWDQDGSTWFVENTSQIKDELNEAWCDVDDWLFGAFFFWNFNADGSVKPPEPRRKDSPDSDEIEKKLFEMGFLRENPSLEKLIQM